MNEETGHKLELRQASRNLVTAMEAGDAPAVAQAFADHATALNSQATAMAASIAQPLYGRFDAVQTQLKELATIFTNARQADLNWRTEERDTRDVQSTRLYAELDKLAAAWEESGRRLKKTEADVDELRGFVSDLGETLSETRGDIGVIDQRVTVLATRMEKVETRVDAVERTLEAMASETGAMQASIDMLKNIADEPPPAIKKRMP